MVEKSSSQDHQEDSFPTKSAVHEQQREWVRRYLRRRVRDQDVVEDLTQETLLRAYQHVQHLRQPDAHRVWLLRIAYHVAMDWFRRDARQEACESLGQPELVAAEEPAVDERSLSAGDHAMLLLAMRQLQPRDRILLIAHYYVGFSCQEISDRIGLSVANVKVRMYRARRQMRELLPVPNGWRPQAALTESPGPGRPRRRWAASHKRCHKGRHQTSNGG